MSSSNLSSSRSDSIRPSPRDDETSTGGDRRHWRCAEPTIMEGAATTAPRSKANENSGENAPSQRGPGAVPFAPSSVSAANTFAASTTTDEATEEDAPSTAALASQHSRRGEEFSRSGSHRGDCDHDSMWDGKKEEQPLPKDDDESNDCGESSNNRPAPLQVVYCCENSTTSNSSPSSRAAFRPSSPHDRRAPPDLSHPLSMVEQYVRSYALNLPSPVSKGKRKKASTTPTPPRRDGNQSAARTPPAGSSVPSLSPSMTTTTTPTTMASSSAALLPPSSKWSGTSRPATSSPATHRRRLRAEAVARATTRPGGSGTGGATAPAAAQTASIGPSTTSASLASPKSQAVLLSCLDGPSLTATDVWEQVHDDSGTTTGAAGGDAVLSTGTGNNARFHEMDPSTVALLGDRKRYRVDVNNNSEDEAASLFRNPSPLHETSVASAASSYSIRIVHELTGRVGSTVPVATLVANAPSPMYQQLDRDDWNNHVDSADEGAHDPKRRKVMASPYGYEKDVTDVPPGSCPLHSALSGVCSAMKKAKNVLRTPPRPPRTSNTGEPTLATATAEHPELQRSEQGRLV